MLKDVGLARTDARLQYDVPIDFWKEASIEAVALVNGRLQSCFAHSAFLYIFKYIFEHLASSCA